MTETDVNGVPLPAVNTLAESKLLAAALSSGDGLAALRQISPECFSPGKYRAVYDAITHLADQGAPVGLDEVRDQLVKRGAAPDGHALFLLGLVQHAPLPSQISYWVERLAESDESRRTLQAGQRLIQLAGAEPSEDRRQAILATLDHLTATSHPSTADSRYLELRGQLIDPAGLRAIPSPAPLVEHFLYRDSLAWLGGKPGHGKSFVAVDLACCVGTGTPWHRHPVAQGRVVYVIAEGASGLSRRVDAWSLAAGRNAEGVLFLPTPVQLLSHLDLAAFGKLLAELRPDLIICDTQARMSVGGEENSSRDMGMLVDNLEHLRRQSAACVLVVHHEARAGENLRGSTALEGAATSILRVSKDGQQVTVTVSKQKDGPEQGPLMLALTPLGDSAVLSHDALGIAGLGTESEFAVLAVLRDSFGPGGATKTGLREASGQSKTTYYRALNALVGKGLVHELKEGRSTRYVLPAEDRQGVLGSDSHESHAVPPVPWDSWESSTWDGKSPNETHAVPSGNNISDQDLSHSPTESHRAAPESPIPTTPIEGGTRWERDAGTRNQDLPCDVCAASPSRVDSHSGRRACTTCAPPMWADLSTVDQHDEAS